MDYSPEQINAARRGHPPDGILPLGAGALSSCPPQAPESAADREFVARMSGLTRYEFDRELMSRWCWYAADYARVGGIFRSHDVVRREIGLMVWVVRNRVGEVA